MGGVTAGGGAAGIVTTDTAEAARGAVIKAETALTVEDTGDTATVETGATPDEANLNVINVISLLID